MYIGDCVGTVLIAVVFWAAVLLPRRLNPLYEYTIWLESFRWLNSPAVKIFIRICGWVSSAHYECIAQLRLWGWKDGAHSWHTTGTTSHRFLQPRWFCQEIWETILEGETWRGKEKTQAEIWGILPHFMKQSLLPQTSSKLFVVSNCYESEIMYMYTHHWCWQGLWYSIILVKKKIDFVL